MNKINVETPCRGVSTFLKESYQRLYQTYGPQHWWPAKTRFEVIVGAILTQNTSWTNVEKAIANLRKRNLLTATALKDVSNSKLASLLKSVGYFNIKAKRLKNFIIFFFREYQGSLKRMGREDFPILRLKLLGVNGIGPETADSILLYALDKPVFVVDAYTKRFLQRHRLINARADYHAMQKLFMDSLRPDVRMFNEYHALLVRLGKEFSRSKFRGDHYPLKDL